MVSTLALWIQQLLIKNEIINMMVGRVILEDPKEKSQVSEDSEVVLEVVI